MDSDDDQHLPGAAATQTTAPCTGGLGEEAGSAGGGGILASAPYDTSKTFITSSP